MGAGVFESNGKIQEFLGIILLELHVIPANKDI